MEEKHNKTCTLAKPTDQTLKGNGMGVGFPVLDVGYKHRACGSYEYVWQQLGADMTFTKIIYLTAYTVASTC